MSDDFSEAESLIKQVTEQARTYVDDYDAGIEAGYAPVPTVIHSSEGGTPDQTRNAYDLASWLEAIAVRDLNDWDWEVQPAVGGSVLEIRGKAG